mmetsp:Transcript_19815/g.49421  ORF Transcript_19815/g.49421 Transcript_19815/m.49421 type:complete len:216 (-) Transcript_19815:195-842(-)
MPPSFTETPSVSWKLVEWATTAGPARATRHSTCRHCKRRLHRLDETGGSSSKKCGSWTKALPEMASHAPPAASELAEETTRANKIGMAIVVVVLRSKQWRPGIFRSCRRRRQTLGASAKNCRRRCRIMREVPTKMPTSPTPRSWPAAVAAVRTAWPHGARRRRGSCRTCRRRLFRLGATENKFSRKCLMLCLNPPLSKRNPNRSSPRRPWRLRPR